MAKQSLTISRFFRIIICSILIAVGVVMLFTPALVGGCVCIYTGISLMSQKNRNLRTNKAPLISRVLNTLGWVCLIGSAFVLVFGYTFDNFAVLGMYGILLFATFMIIGAYLVRADLKTCGSSIKLFFIKCVSLCRYLLIKTFIGGVAIGKVVLIIVVFTMVCALAVSFVGALAGIPIPIAILIAGWWIAESNRMNQS